MAPREAASMLTLGQVATAHGVNGWLLVRSFADPPDSLLDHEEWILQAAGGATRRVKLLEGAPHGERLRVKLEGIADRDAALELRGWWVQVARSALPPLASGEHYRDDLVGFEVVNAEDKVLGNVDYFADLPTGAVMVVRGRAGEHWVPAGPPHLRKIDAAARRLTVDWPTELD